MVKVGKSMDETHREKLRRFSLAMALALLTFLAADLTIYPNARVPILGVPFIISRPALLPFGVAIASFFSAVRFTYYGLMLETSPYRKRRDLIDNLLVHSDERIRPDGTHILGPYPFGNTIWMWWGPRKFSLAVWRTDRCVVEAGAAAFDNAFPKFLWARATTTIRSDPSFNDDGEEYMTYNVDIVRPKRCRIAAAIEDIDYTSPVWLNGIALVCFVWRALTGHLMPTTWM
jgi:hypothetical protein